MSESTVESRLANVEEYVASGIKKRERDRLAQLEALVASLSGRIAALDQQVVILSRAVASPLNPQPNFNGQFDL